VIKHGIPQAMAPPPSTCTGRADREGLRSQVDAQRDVNPVEQPVVQDCSVASSSLPSIFNPGDGESARRRGALGALLTRAGSEHRSVPVPFISVGASADQSVPSGGYEQSGNDREHGVFGFEELLEVKVILGHKTA
jgi:hypothetical protein